MASITIATSYAYSCMDKVELPDNVQFKDIKEFYIKHHSFYYTLDDVKWHEIRMDPEGTASLRQPRHFTVYPNDPETENPDFNVVLASA